MNKPRLPRPDSRLDIARREFLLRALSVGAFAGGMGWNLDALAALFGKVPGKLPEGKSIFDLRGDVTVNGKPATYDTVIRGTDSVKVGSDSHLVAAVGTNAFILRERSVLDLNGRDLVVNSMRLITGKLLSVFGKRNGSPLAIHTPTATIGIRGTGLYAESDPEKTYLCTCYGTVSMKSTANPKEDETVTTTHHNAPRWILKDPDAGKRIIPAGFRDHTDLELMTVEALVGRTVPFGMQDGAYDSPRREY